MKKWLTVGGSLLLLLLACKSSKDPSQHFISIPSLVEAQVAHVDSSLYSITRYDYRGTDTIPFDTIYISREEFRKEAAAFLSLPDLSLPRYAKRFTEESRYDELLERVIISYLPIDAKNEEMQKEELQVSPSVATGDKVTTLLASKAINDRNGLRQEELIWLIDKSFTIVRTTQLPGQPAELITTKVSWNE
ncbi:MAG: hypothetical protein ACKOC7_08565 [Sphingomonadales bacterium]